MDTNSEGPHPASPPRSPKFVQLAWCYPFPSLSAHHRFCSSVAGERGHGGAAGAAVPTHHLQYCATGLQENTGEGLSDGLDTQYVLWLLTFCTNVFHSAAFSKSNGDCRRVYNLSHDAI